MLQTIKSIVTKSNLQEFSNLKQLEELYTTPEEFLEAITQKINVFEAVYRCANVILLPTSTIEDEYIVAIFEIMSQKLRAFYGGRFLIQMWARKIKIFQSVHNQCSYIYVANFFQEVFQRINHPFYSESHPNGVHERSIFVDPRQLIVINTDGTQMVWGSLKIETLLSQTKTGKNDKSKVEASMQVIDEEQEKLNITQDFKVDYVNVLDNCHSDDKPEEIIAIHSVSSEGYMRKEIHFVIETELKIHVYQLTPTKTGLEQTFDMDISFEFDKQFVEIGVTEKIKSISLEGYADRENLLIILKANGDAVVMSESIHRQMVEYLNSIKQAQEEEESSDDEEELARIAALEAKRKKFLYRMTKICRGPEEPLIPRKKVKDSELAKNEQFNSVRNFFQQKVRPVQFVVYGYFVRRQTLYFYGEHFSDIRRMQITELKNFDPIAKATKLTQILEVTMLSDVTLHLNLFNDFLIANTSLIISHQKILSIYNFLNNQWNHMLPSEQGNIDQESQTYFGMPGDEIEQLLLSCIFTNSIYDCIIKYKGKFIRRLKYYNELDKTYFEKGHVFENQEVLQLQRNVDARNYRQFGDQTIRTLFMIQDKIMQIQQIWVSENGSRITKLVDQIPIDYEWQLVDIPNARSDMLIIYSKKMKQVTIYNISNSKQCLYPNQLQKYLYLTIDKVEWDLSVATQYFIFFDKLYYQKNGNLMVQDLRQKLAAPEEINFNKNIKEFYMTHHESVYYKDKNNVFRFAQLSMQKEFDIDKLPTEIFNCRGAFCTKLEYSITTNRIALFTSSFEISVIPLLDRNRIDLMASQDFEHNFICWKEIDNTLIALKRPNILVTWNTDTGKIVNYHQCHGMDFTKYMKHTEWNGTCLMKEVKEAKSNMDQKGRQSEKKKGKDDLGNESDDSNKSYDLDDGLQVERTKQQRSGHGNHLYSLIEIVSPKEIVQHCEFYQEFKPGRNIYVSKPYMLVMDDFCTKMYLLQGPSVHKTYKHMHTFYEQQMKFGKPIYFSPNFHHRLFIDSNTKQIILNFALTNTNIFSIDIRKQLLFQIEKTHPMIYFHDNNHIVGLTNVGVEKLYEIKYEVKTKRRKGFCELTEKSNIYYNEKQFTRRFILDPLNFNPFMASQMESTDILMVRGDILKRNLHFNVYLSANSDVQHTQLSRFYKDKNIGEFNHFIINNYRQQLSFSYLTWKVIEELSSKNIQLNELSIQFLSELCYTVLPDQRNVYHLLGREYEVLDSFLKYINNENIEEVIQEDVELSDILFIPNLQGKTPLHESTETNNTRVTDRFVSALMNTDFDHHARFVLTVYPKLIEQVPQRMSQYLDSRLKVLPWIQDYTRGRIETEGDIDFVMTAEHMWTPEIGRSLETKMYDQSALEVPLTMEVMDMPHLHKYKNDVADDFLEALANTDCIEIFSNSSIQALIEIKWPLVKTAIKRFLFYPYLLFLLIFLYYTVYVFEKYNEKEEKKDDDKKEGASEPGAGDQKDATATDAAAPTTDPVKAGLLILQEVVQQQAKSSVPSFDDLKNPEFWKEKEMIITKVVVQLFAIYFFLIEVRQMFVAGAGRYLSSPWNYLDLIPLALISISISFENLGFQPQYERPLNAVACFFMWIKFLYFWRIFKKTAKFISMIIAIVSDLKVFLLVFLVTLTAFGNAMYIMSNNSPECDEKCQELPDDKKPTGTYRFIDSYVDSIFFAYMMSLGDFDTGELGSVYTILVISTFVAATLFLTIMMLNILIAVISDSYARVESTSVEEVYKNFADLISENEYLVKDQRLVDHDKMGDYLYIAKVDKNDDGDSEAWEGLLTSVKKSLNKRTQGIEQLLRQAQKNLLNTVNTQSEQYIQHFKDTSARNNQKIKQITLKIDAYGTGTGGGKKGGQGIASRRDSFMQDDDKSSSPIQLNHSSFQRKTMKAAGLIGQALMNIQGVAGGRTRAITTKQLSESIKKQDLS